MSRRGPRAVITRIAVVGAVNGLKRQRYQILSCLDDHIATGGRHGSTCEQSYARCGRKRKIVCSAHGGSLISSQSRKSMHGTLVSNRCKRRVTAVAKAPEYNNGAMLACCLLNESRTISRTIRTLGADVPFPTPYNRRNKHPERPQILRKRSVAPYTKS